MDALYHYCSTPIFHSIMRSRSIWLSSLSLSNDSMEGKLVAKAITRLAERDGLDRNTVERLQEWLAIVENESDGLGFCLSEEGDLLSQWRGYAADATGVAIGFSRAYLEEIATSSAKVNPPGFSLNRVEYSLSGHENMVEPFYRELRKHIDNGAFKLSEYRGLLDTRADEEIEEERKRIASSEASLFFSVLELSPMLFHLKTHAFVEEREWRLVSFFIQGLVDSCLYRTSSDRVIPYRSFELTTIDRPPIAEVVLGPKHKTPPHIVRNFLKECGFGEVEVRRSDASYR
ncbi:MAG: DUF2971 domain-containing protein [Geobacteraceae bacterium]|nr:MAG: DUF2971 domain-containing protein [Geobacteraceae bacterium]RPI72929.1 MAG: DUF2971 domain-containing protein [Geobacteraceae bacterium]